MGLFKSVKDMKSMVSAAPGLIDQANQMSANAQAMQQAQAMAFRGNGVSAAPAPSELFAPIAGVELAVFAQISAGLEFIHNAEKGQEFRFNNLLVPLNVTITF